MWQAYRKFNWTRPAAIDLRALLATALGVGVAGVVGLCKVPLNLERISLDLFLPPQPSVVFQAWLMTAGITSLALRSSPTRRSIIQRASQLAHVQTVPMLGKCIRENEANRPKDLAKQLFPSSSPQAPNADIRDQLKKPGAASASARNSNASLSPLKNRSSGLNPTLASRTLPGPSRGSIHTLYNNSNSFKDEPSVIDLTGPEAQAKAREAVYFAEDDFSDDENLDLDYEAPVALPTLPPPPKTSRPSAKENMPPPPSSIQPETMTEWSSSPAHHFAPPRQPQRSLSGVSNTTDRSLKRESSGDQESSVPVLKKAKKRALPSNWKQGDPDDEDQGYQVAPATKTPSYSKSKDYWDPSASAVKEQKRQLKIQRQPKKADNDLPPEAIAEITKSHAKNFAISLTEEQRHVLDLVVNKNKSVFFTGPAGTGKSVLMRAIINDLKKKYAKDPERVAVTASTGLAACNIGGITLHSFSGTYT